MIDSVIAGLSGLGAGVAYLFSQGLPNAIMLAVGGTLLYLGAKKDVEPMLLLPIGMGCVLVNIPLSELGMHLGEISRHPRVYLSCLSGGRSGLATRTLGYVGLQNVVNVTGGFRAWKNAGHPVRK